MLQLVYEQVSNISIVWLGILGLSTWRIASAIHAERIGRPLRTLFGVKEEGDLLLYPETLAGEFISCFWCISFWAGLVTLILWVICPLLVLPFALSGGAILIQTWIGRE